MLLALMLVFAMIPLSASAVDALPEVTGVWVNDVQATPNGDKAYSAEIVESTEIEVQVQLNSAKGGKVAYYHEFDAINDKKAERDYTLNIVTAEMEEPELISMILKSEVTGETLEGRIEGPNVYFDNKEGENAIP